MTDMQAAPAAPQNIDDGAGTMAAAGRQADAGLRQGPDGPGDVRHLRQAVREDATAARDWGRNRAGRLKGAVGSDPVKASLYALGPGVLIGLLVSR